MPLYGFWHDNAFFVWGENRPTGEGSSGNGSGWRTLRGEELRASVGEMSADALLASVAVEGEVSLWLPDGHGKLAAKTVSVLRMAACEAIDFLTSLPVREETPVAIEGVAEGETGAVAVAAVPRGTDTISYWSLLATFVLRRISQEQFFPDVVQRRERLISLWRLLIASSADADHLEKFAEAMPAACRAVVGGESEPTAILESFIGATTDALIRRFLISDEFFAAFPARTDLENSPEVRWIKSLLSADPVMADDGTNSLLVDLTSQWVRKLDQNRTAPPVQVRLTLEEPIEDTEDEVPEAQPPWMLRIALLPLERDAEPLELEDLYDPDTPATGVLSRNILEWRNKLLSELQRAMEYFPLADRAYRNAEGAEGKSEIRDIPINTTEAHAFIHQWAPALMNKGFVVVLPEWATAQDRELGLMLYLDEPERDEDELDPIEPGKRSAKGNGQPLSPGQFGLNTLLNFDWRVAVGDMQISTDQFKGLVEQGAPLVKFQGRWLQLSPENARKALAFLETKENRKLTLAEALRTAYAQPTDTGLPILGVSGVGTIRDFLEQAPNKQMQQLGQPAAFAGTLRPYQLRGLNWLAFLDSLGIGACLADDMGLGKTIQLIALLLQERGENAEGGMRNAETGAPSTFMTPLDAGAPGDELARVGPTLLFAPTSVVGNWVREIQRFGESLKVLIHHGPERLRGDAFVEEAQNLDVVITSYALAHRDFNDLMRVPWHRIALDEAQKIKNPSAAATIAIRKLPGNKRIALTGTPVENHLSELWSIMDVLNPGLLGSAGDFRERFAVPIEKMQNSNRALQLRKLIQPFVLRRTKLDPQIVGDLPEKMENRVYCNLTPEQASLYEATTAQMLAQIDEATGMRRRGLILGALTRLKQICDHPLLVTPDAQAAMDVSPARSGKCERLIDMLEEVLEAGDAALVFTQYRQMGHLLERMIAERLRHPLQFLHGGSTAKQRNDMIQRFQSPQSDTKIFILSLRAGGLGLNLTAANHVFHFDRWWNPAVEAQATDRAHRIGQTKKVLVHKFICIGTLEERIDRLLADKLAVAGQIVTSGDQWLTNLSTDDLRSYLALSDEAVAEV